ncbi:MAG: MGMT family protein [Deltaproteobacteria bacterium]|nr:MGMT family protein [Deltaproteobacteria bacterium]
MRISLKQKNKTAVQRMNHGYKLRRKLRGIIPSAVRDCSTNKFQYTSFLKFEFHNKKIIKQTPFGSVCVIWSVSNKTPLIVHVLLPRPGLSAEDQAFALFPDSREYSCAEIDAIAVSIKAYLEGENIKFSLKSIDLPLCSAFQQSVLRATYSIPRGSVSTYQRIAVSLDIPKGARAVGNALANNPFPLIVPCHRVISSNRHIGGYGGGIEMKQVLLEREGIGFDHTGLVIDNRFHF